MVGIIHIKFLNRMVREYKNKGYEKVDDLKFLGYQPDAVVQNETEIVLLEAVFSHDHPTVILPFRIGSRSVRMDTRYVDKDKMRKRLLLIKKRFVESPYVVKNRKVQVWAERPEITHFEGYICDQCKKKVNIIYHYRNKSLCAGCILSVVSEIISIIDSRNEY